VQSELNIKGVSGADPSAAEEEREDSRRLQV